MKKNLNPLYLTENDNNKKQRRKKTGIIEPILGFGAAYGAKELATNASVKPLIKHLDKYYDGGSGSAGNYDFLKDVKVNNQSLDKFLKRNNLQLDYKHKSPIGPHFVGKTVNIAGLNKKGTETIGKNILAHELGHSQSAGKSDIIPLLYQASKATTGATALLQLINCFNNDDEERRKVAKGLSIAGGISAIPMIAEEINACIIGNEMLGLEGMEAAKTYIGVPSYIALALSPTIIYGVSEGTRKLLRVLREYLNKDPIAKAKVNNLKKQNVKVKIK